MEVITGICRALLKCKTLEIKALFILEGFNKEPYYAANLRLCLSISADALIDVPLFLCFEMKTDEKKKTAELKIKKIASVGH